MKRRKVLKRLALGVASLTAAGIPYGLSRLLAPDRLTTTNIHYLRPPGALSDATAFNEACIGCGLCGEVCPPKSIRFSDREGGSRFNTPYIDPAKKGCILCGKCMEICPTDALTEVDRKDIEMGIAQIDRTACYPWVDRGVCGACVVACPLGEHAIGFDFANMYRPVIKKGCVGCGVCVEVCPHPSLPIRIAARGSSTVVVHQI